ncbi:selenoprotein S-like isoform X1 [Acipenser ruthenus]|uniref:selenoprotein S-like isoform X1 n=1 Tax=Acipenser ruthenus TaxID=7906 RepID=UPI002740E199|nr:selenoprotein S-like isoform X1 [Acipenser ruthenus]
METEEDATEIKTKPTLEHQGVEFLQQTVGALVSDYGWYILFGGVAVYLVIQHLSKRRGSQESSGPRDVPDPSTVVRRQEALDTSRRRMQEELDAKAEQYKEKQKQLEEEKRRQKIEMWESMQEGKSYKGNTKLSQQQSTEESSSTSVLKPKSGKKPLRSGFNPLSGEGGGACSYRPGRRGPSSGG